MKVICVAAVISGEAKNIFHKVFRLVSSEAQIYTAFYVYLCIRLFVYNYTHLSYIRKICGFQYGTVCGKYTDNLKKLHIRLHRIYIYGFSINFL